MAKRAASDLHVITHDKRMRYDPLGYRGTDDIWTQFGTNPTTGQYGLGDYENLSFCDLLKDDAFSPALTTETLPTPELPPSTVSLNVTPPSFDSRRPFSSVENLYAKCGTSPPGSVQPPLQHHFPISPTISQAPPLMPLTPPPSNSSSSSSASSTVVVQRTPPPAPPHMSFAAYPQGHHQLPCPVTRPLPQMTHQPQLHPLHPGGPNIISRPPPPPPTIHHQLQHQHQQQQQQQQQHQQHPQQPPQGSGTSFDPILFKIVRQKATGTNTGVFFYFKIYDKVYRGRRDSFSKDKSIMYLRCNTCPRSVNKEPCKWRAKIRLLKDPDEMFAKPELMRLENFLVISNPKGHHHSYHCTQTHIDIDNLHKGRPKVTTTAK